MVHPFMAASSMAIGGRLPQVPAQGHLSLQIGNYMSHETQI